MIGCQSAQPVDYELSICYIHMIVPKKKIKIRIKKDIKQRAPHKPTRAHKDKTKYTRKGRVMNKRRKELLKEWQQSIEE